MTSIVRHLPDLEDVSLNDNLINDKSGFTIARSLSRLRFLDLGMQRSKVERTDIGKETALAIAHNLPRL